MAISTALNGDPPHISDSDSDRFRPVLLDNDPNAIVTDAPEEPFRLGRLDVGCLVINRMIGTGIFSSVDFVVQGTRSIGVSLLFWFFGVIYCLAGVHLYIEYGLSTPRRRFEGVEQGIPRSGGDLNYLQYVYRKPNYRKGTVLLSVTTFAAVFIMFGNVAGNCVNFAVRALQASNAEVTNEAVRGISIAVALFTCFIHTLSRRGGILLSNLFAMVKLAMLFLILIAAIVAATGAFPQTESAATKNFDPETSFRGASTQANDYANAFLLIIFTFSGFEQPNYVLGEISRPRRNFPVSMITSVSLVGILYMSVNIAYMAIVPKPDLFNEQVNLAERFFELTFGRLNVGDNTGQRIFNAFLAVSSFGNIVVMTYTAARVKQEIAKEGILPFPKFFAKNRDFSFGRLLRWAHRRPTLARLFGRILKSPWFAPEHHSEKTPVGALTLHFGSCLVLLMATYGVEPNNTYSLLSRVYTYAVHTFFGVLLAGGILYLRLNGKEGWRKKAVGINPFLSLMSAIIYLFGSLFPVIVSWVEPSGEFKRVYTTTIKWYLVPLLSWSAIAFGAVWWLGFIILGKRTEKRTGTVFTIQREPTFERDPPVDGPPIQVNETVYFAWVAKENLPDGQDSEGGQDDFASHDFANGDFAGMNAMTDFDHHLRQ
ncbi:high affinity methionine permease [Blastomyces gilchristii SLH14081]|uniref:High affinity methionine permease n=1 Tax=Blastomyces gilchristii (strain SLH14081) TaxID=559298 RepID=A0A179U8L9_BLAGS|nr:high affinity methionine permease [Blastomyces gilchristii SLH14081]OAT03341.1 high affinity methionine permease [Blastomyces gilchristii SLH14081]